VKVLVYDTTERGWPFLSTWWALGALISGTDEKIAAPTWADAYLQLAKIRQPIDLLMVWGHGTAGRPLINGRAVNLDKLAQSCTTLRPESEVWFRSCEVFRGQKGKRFAEDAVAALGCNVVAHTKVVSAPNPLWQRGLCALRPGERPWWTDEGDELPGCSTLAMRVPPKAYR